MSRVDEAIATLLASAYERGKRDGQAKGRAAGIGLSSVFCFGSAVGASIAGSADVSDRIGLGVGLLVWAGIRWGFERWRR